MIKKKEPKKVALSIRIDEILHKRLSEDAKKEMRSFNNMLEKILVQFYQNKK